MKTSKIVKLLQEIWQFLEVQHSTMIEFNIASNLDITKYNNMLEKITLAICTLTTTKDVVHDDDSVVKLDSGSNAFLEKFDLNNIDEYRRLYKLNKASFEENTKQDLQISSTPNPAKNVFNFDGGEPHTESINMPTKPLPLRNQHHENHEQEVGDDCAINNFIYPFVKVCQVDKSCIPAKNSPANQEVDDNSHKPPNKQIGPVKTSECNCETPAVNCGYDTDKISAPNAEQNNSNKKLQEQRGFNCNSHRPYSCNQCEATFIQRCHLICHLRIHSDEKPFTCPQCPAKFRHKSNLTCHIRIHTGEKPYSCTLCKRSFGQKGQLNCHMFKHTGIKPYKCESCSASFSHRGHLNAHVRTHTGVKPYQCFCCNKSFSQKGNLKTHMKRHNEK